MTAIIGFSVCAILIFFAGKKLSYYGDLLAELTNIGKAWIGLVLMAAVTSLPELMVGISSSAIVQSADLAVGDIAGSCALNLCILALMDGFTPKNKPLLSTLSNSNILAASFGLIMVSIIGLGFFLDPYLRIFDYLGVATLTLPVVYLISVKMLHGFQPTQPEEQSDHNIGKLPQVSLQFVIIRFTVFALLIVLAASALPYFADHIAEQTGLSRSFVGSIFLAFSTSLPEIAISFASVRMGYWDMAVGNLLGSNIFNALILFLDDIFYTKGLLLEDASSTHLLSIFFVLLMTALIVLGFILKRKQKQWWMAPETIIMFLLYGINMILMYTLSVSS